MEFSERFRQVVDEHNSRRGDEAFANEVLDEFGLAHAYKLGKIKVYDKPKMLMDYGIKTAPQSFVYV